MKSFLLMLTFFTRIPIKYSFEYRERDLRNGIILMPLIGLIIGIIMFGVSHLSPYLDKMIMSVLIWIIYIWITGALHLDGLADTVDGIYSNRDRKRMLEIMKDSRIGTFGVISIIVVLLFNITLTNLIDYKLLIMIPVVGRACALLTCATGKSAREKGMGKTFISKSGWREGIFAIIYLFTISVFINYKLILPVVFTLIATTYYIRYLTSKLGGITGDNIGFMIEITQTVFVFTTYLSRGILL